MLTFLDLLRYQSVSRAKMWHGSLSHWDVMQWACAAADEMGEACNVAKKLQRIREGIAKRAEEMHEGAAKEQILQLGEEIADTIIYLDLLAASEGINLEREIRKKFNSVSVKYGFPQRL